MFNYKKRYDHKKKDIIKHLDYWTGVEARTGSLMAYGGVRCYSDKLRAIEYWESWDLKYISLLTV